MPRQKHKNQTQFRKDYWGLPIEGKGGRTIGIEIWGAVASRSFVKCAN